MSDICPITNQSCYYYVRRGALCADKITVEDAANCIRNLRAIIADQDHEIEALDELLETYKEGRGRH